MADLLPSNSKPICSNHLPSLKFDSVEVFKCILNAITCFRVEFEDYNAVVAGRKFIPFHDGRCAIFLAWIYIIYKLTVKAWAQSMYCVKVMGGSAYFLRLL